MLGFNFVGLVLSHWFVYLSIGRQRLVVSHGLLPILEEATTVPEVINQLVSLCEFSEKLVQHIVRPSNTDSLKMMTN